MKLKQEAKDKQIKELEKLVLLMTNSALATEDETSIKKLKGVMESYTSNLNSLSNENYLLKSEIANEKKRYVDLMNAFLEVRNEKKQNTIDESNSENSIIFE